MDLLIIGAGGHGKVVLEILRAQGAGRVIGFLDADPALAGKSIQGVPILGQVNLLPKFKAQKVRSAIVAIGDNRTRVSYAKLLREQGFELLNAVHPRAVVSPSAILGKNIVIAAMANVGPDTFIGDSTIINTGAVVEHECRIESGVHVCPAAALAGRVCVGAEAFVGLGCRIIQCLSVGAGATIGAGSVIIRDVPDGATVVGTPGRVIRRTTLEQRQVAIA